MWRMDRCVVYVVVVLTCIGFVDKAQADTINLVTGWNLNWNITSNPAESPAETIQIQNAAVSSNTVFNGYDLGLKFNLVSGSGQIALDVVSNPSSNSIVPAWLYSPPVAGTSSVYNIASAASDVVVPNSPTSLVTLDFKPGAVTPAPGSVFQIVSDHTLTDYLNHLGVSTLYANNSASDVVLGTVTVMSVPEPSSMLLLGIAALGFAVTCARREVRRGDARAVCAV